ncbi:MAG TPA: class I SAM-dependent methyltransferase [Smithellaceae bacterium]|nr:class I SAM-dependent methyltransferase [Smithellaceae bacterium]
MDREYFVSPAAEKRRYEEHKNDIHDPRYQEFVGPIVSKIQERFTNKHRGLDYGAGTGPVIAKLLRDKGYSIELYDPFFWNDATVLDATYDFVVCCEVIEHFHSPAKEFKRLRSLLKPGGALYCMTDLYSEDTDFKNWYYKNDPTHVFFYKKNTLEWIKKQLGFVSFEQKDRITLFSN